MNTIQVDYNRETYEPEYVINGEVVPVQDVSIVGVTPSQDDPVDLMSLGDIVLDVYGMGPIPIGPVEELDNMVLGLLDYYCNPD